jgi:rare lipoprotein A (peptidoglycan hydrolase)
MINLAVTIWTLINLILSGGLQSPTPAKVYETTRSGIASWYESGHTTACGGPYDPDGITIALSADYFSRALCDREVRITYGDTVVYATITDRMPSNGRLVDLSRGTHHALGTGGLGQVTIEY